MSDSKARLINYKQFLQDSREPAVGARIWKWSDLQAKLDDVAENDPLEPGRWAVSMVNEDAGKAVGVCPSLNMLVQVLEPGCHGKPHRHSNFAIFIVKEGSGYSVIDGEKIEWEQGDVFFAPPWARHEHCNDSATENAVLYTVQDVPTVTNMGLWYFQGSDNTGFQHVVKEDDAS